MKTKKLVFIVTETKDNNGTTTHYETVGDEQLIDKLEIYFVEKTLNKLRYKSN